MSIKTIANLLKRCQSLVTDLALAMDVDPTFLLHAELRELRAEVVELKRTVAQTRMNHQNAA